MENFSIPLLLLSTVIRKDSPSWSSASLIQWTFPINFNGFRFAPFAKTASQSVWDLQMKALGKQGKNLLLLFLWKKLSYFISSQWLYKLCCQQKGRKEARLVSAVFAQAGIRSQTSSEMFVLLFIWLVAARVVTSWFASSTQNYWASTDWSALANTHIPHIYEVFPLFTSHQPQICPSLFLQTLKKLLSRAPRGRGVCVCTCQCISGNSSSW